MPSNDALKEELNSLKSQIKNQNKLIETLNTNQTALNRQIHSIEKKIDPTLLPEAEISQKENNSKSLGIILIVIGAVLCLTVIGLIIGIPLLIWGIILVKKKDQPCQAQNIRLREEPNIAQFQEPSRQATPDKKHSFEEDMGMKWFARIGIVALVIGAGFFIKYAIEMNWINHLTRIILGCLFGAGLIVFGSIISKNEDYARWAKTLIGGGFAFTYFVVFSAYHFPEYQRAIGISQTIDILLLILIALVAVLYSIKDNSQIIAAESFFLGYLTSYLSNDFGTLSLVYSLILTFGLVSVVCYKRWPLIGLGGVPAAYAAYLLWMSGNSQPFIYTSIVLVSTFLAFSIQSFFLMKKQDSFRFNISAIIINSTLFFIFYYIEFYTHYMQYRGLFALAVCVFYFLAYLAYKRTQDTKYIVTYLYAALFFLTLSIPIQLNGAWITIAWVVEALILIVLFLKLNLYELRLSAYLVSGVTAIKNLVYDTLRLNALDFQNIFNSTRLIAFFATIIVFYVIYALLKRNKDKLSEYESAIPSVYAWISFALLVLLAFIELNSKYSVWLSVVWSIIALILVFFYSKNSRLFLYQSLGVSLLVFLKIIFHDSWKLAAFDNYDLLSSTRFIAFLAGILVFYSISIYLGTKPKIMESKEINIPHLFCHAGSLLLFLLILVEVDELGISIGWSILALFITLLGFTNKKKHLRIQGMVIFSIVILKVFLYDTRNLDTIYRTISYFVLGGLLLLVSFIYTKYKNKLMEIL